MLSTAILRKTRGFTQQKSLQHAAVLFSGKVGVQLIGLLSQPILARLYSPADFGEFALLNSVLAILLIASSGRYEAGIVLTRRPQQARRLFQLAQFLLAAYVVLISLVLLTAPERLHLWFSEKGLASNALWLLPFLLLFSGYWQIVQNWLVRFQKYSQISLALFSQRLIILFASLLAVVFNYPGNGLIFGLAVGCIAVFGVSLYLQREPLAFKQKEFKSYARHYGDFPLFSAPSIFILVFTQHLPVLWLTFFYEKSMTGSFSLAFAFIMLPLISLRISAGQVTFERMTKSTGPNQLKLLKRLFALYLLILLPYSLLLLAYGQQLVVFILGTEWQQAGQFISFLSPIVLFQGLSYCLTLPLSIIRKQSYSLLFQAGMLLMWGAALVLGKFFFDDLYWTFSLMSLFSLLHLVLVWHVMRSLLKNSWTPTL